jgi:hypothetical protein
MLSAKWKRMDDSYCSEGAALPGYMTKSQMKKERPIARLSFNSGILSP